MHFLAAAQAGAPEAWYLLADMAAEGGRLLEARKHLDAYFQASTGGLAHEPAQALQARVQSTQHLVALSERLATIEARLTTETK